MYLERWRATMPSLGTHATETCARQLQLPASNRQASLIASRDASKWRLIQATLAASIIARQRLHTTTFSSSGWSADGLASQ
jgi:hypothetical protein